MTLDEIREAMSEQQRQMKEADPAGYRKMTIGALVQTMSESFWAYTNELQASKKMLMIALHYTEEEANDILTDVNVKLMQAFNEACDEKIGDVPDKEDKHYEEHEHDCDTCDIYDRCPLPFKKARD